MEPIITNINEVSLRYKQSENCTRYSKVKSVKDSYNLFMTFYDSDTIAFQEEFLVMYLDNSGEVLGVYKASKGGITYTVADVRLIMNIALRCFCTQIIISHNHPSGLLKVSEQDKLLTKKLQECCVFHEIKLLDHIIVAPDNRYLSFVEEGLI